MTRVAGGSRTSGRGGSDRGAALALVALSLVVMLVLMAFAVDIGSLTVERRRAQTAADGAALAGGGALLRGGDDGDAADEVILVSYDNLDTGGSLTDWRNRWISDCTDPDRPAGYVASSVSPCISYNVFRSRIRVRLPTLRLRTQFARAIGVNQLSTTAVAEAELVPNVFGRVLPFAMPSSSASATELCLKSGQKPDDIAPCSGPVSGNFGSLDLSLFGNPLLGTPEICGNAQTNTKLAANMILGVDHPLDEFLESPQDPLDPLTETIRDDHTLCPDLAARPNALWAQTGVGPALDDGLVKGITLEGKTYEGRLAQGPYATREVRQQAPDLDDRPLWEYIPTDLTTGIPASCLRSSFGTTATANKTQMKTCLTDYTAAGATTDLFVADDDADGTIDLLETPRFGFVPQFHEPEFLSGTNRYLIKEFTPTFLQTLYFSCNPNGCAGSFDPGETGSGLPLNHNREADALTSLLLPRDSVPEVALSTAPGGTFTRELILRS